MLSYKRTNNQPLHPLKFDSSEVFSGDRPKSSVGSRMRHFVNGCLECGLATKLNHTFHSKRLIDSIQVGRNGMVPFLGCNLYNIVTTEDRVLVKSNPIDFVTLRDLCGNHPVTNFYVITHNNTLAPVNPH